MSYYVMAIYFWSILVLAGLVIAAFGLFASKGTYRSNNRSQRLFHHHSAPSHPGL